LKRWQTSVTAPVAFTIGGRAHCQIRYAMRFRLFWKMSGYGGGAAATGVSLEQ
jgi:hypothetical protein